MKTQILTAVTVNLLSLNYGIANGWIAPNLLRFQSEDSPIGLLSAEEAALVVSSLCIGGFVGTLLFGFLADWCGRKWTLVWIAIPQIVANGLLAFGTRPNYVYAARLLFGLAGGGVFAVLPIFVAEISQESIRGALGTILPFNWTAGIVLGYVLASWMDYFLVPFVCASFGILFIVIFVWLPESPDYLLHINQKKRAQESFDFYGNHRKTNGGQVLQQEGISWRDFQEPAVRRGCFIAFTLIFFADTCGIITITNYITELLNWADIELDVYAATVALGMLQIVGCGISLMCMDRFGRRVLFMTSALFSSIAMYVFGIYFYMHGQSSMQVIVSELRWLPLASLSVAILAASLAIGAAPFIMIAELLPVKLRGRVTTIALAVSWGVAFIVMHSFHQLVQWIGVEGAYWVYATVCLIEVGFVYWFLPETKNLTFEQIQAKLAKGGDW